MEEKLANLQDKLSQLTREHAQLQAENMKLRDKLTASEQSRITLEQKNDELEEKLRICAATEDDLREALNRSEEESIFLQNDLDGRCYQPLA